MWKVEAVADAKNPRTEVTDAEVGVPIPGPSSNPVYVAQTSVLKTNHKIKTSAHKKDTTFKANFRN